MFFANQKKCYSQQNQARLLRIVILTEVINIKKKN